MLNQKRACDFVYLGSQTSLHKAAICDENTKQSRPLMFKCTSACTLNHHQPTVTTTRVSRCASTSDVNYARYDVDLVNRLLVESEARRLAIILCLTTSTNAKLWFFVPETSVLIFSAFNIIFF